MIEDNRTTDISVLQLLTKLVKETDRLVRLADDIDTHAATPQAKAAFQLIGTGWRAYWRQIHFISIRFIRLYDLDPGMMSLGTKQA